MSSSLVAATSGVACHAVSPAYADAVHHISSRSPNATSPSAPCCDFDSDSVTWVRGPAADRDRLEQWCAGVGPAVMSAPAAWLDSTHGQTARADMLAPSVDELAIISWNTNVGGGDVAGLIDDLRAGRLTGGDSVHHFVLLLQEVYRADRSVPRGNAARPRRIAPTPARGVRSDIVQVAREHGLHLLYVPSMANGWGDAGAAEDRGNAIMSSLPLHAPTAIELPFEGQRRVAVSATVTVANAAGRAVALRAVSVHLDNRSRFARAFRSFGSGRARQASSLAEALLRDSTTLGPTVVAGDLNTWAPVAWERALPVLRRHFPLGNDSRGPTFAGPPMGVGRTLDHMMFRLPQGEEGTGTGVPTFATPSSVRLDNARGSDHYPLLARLTLHAGD